MPVWTVSFQVVALLLHKGLDYVETHGDSAHFGELVSEIALLIYVHTRLVPKITATNTHDLDPSAAHYNACFIVNFTIQM